MNREINRQNKLMFDDIIRSTIYLYDDVRFSALIPGLRRAYSADEIFLIEHIPEQSSDLFTVMAGNNFVVVEIDRGKGSSIALDDIHDMEQNSHLSKKSRARARFITYEKEKLINALRNQLANNYN